MKTILAIFTAFALLISCGTNNSKEIILEASREAPLGWVYLEIYADSTFKFTLTGIRNNDDYIGKVKISNDTIYFDYADTIPKAGNLAIIQNESVSYVAGEYGESLQITANKLK